MESLLDSNLSFLVSRESVFLIGESFRKSLFFFSQKHLGSSFQKAIQRRMSEKAQRSLRFIHGKRVIDLEMSNYSFDDDDFGEEMKSFNSTGSVKFLLPVRH